MGDKEMTSYRKRAQKIYQHAAVKASSHAGLSRTNEERRERGRPLSQEVEERVADAFFKRREGAAIRTISKEAHVKWESAATWLEVFRLQGMARMVEYGNLKVYIPVKSSNE